MRKIKFRAYDNKKKKWLLGYELENLGGFSLFGECMLLGEWSGILDTFLMSRKNYKPDDLKVMQFTGLKDSKNRDVYEGDYVKVFDQTVDDYEGEDLGGVWVVEWGKYGASFILSSCYKGTPCTERGIKELDSLEVIGNIYSDPKLLTNKQHE